MNETRKSDDLIVPKKPSNKVDTGTGKRTTSTAEKVEGKGSTEGNPGQQIRHRTQRRERLQRALDWIRQAARRDRKQQFTALWHHHANRTDWSRRIGNSIGEGPPESIR